LNPSIPALTKAHLDWLELRRSPATASFYFYAHQRLNEFVASGDASDRLDRWKPATADQYARWLAGKGVKAVTVRHYVSAVVTLGRWAVGQSYLSKHPLAGYTPPAGKPETVTGFRPEEVKAMLDACKATPTGRRNRAIVAFLLDTGVRASECCALTIGDVDVGRGTALVRHGKGDKARLVFFSDAAGALLCQYLLRYHPAGEDSAAPLFPGRGCQPFTRSGLRRLIVALAKAADLDLTRCGPHKLRHAAAEQILMNGGNTRFVQDLLGHSDGKTVQRYTKFLAADLLQQHRRTSPMDHLTKAASVAPARKRA
jgi:site-specific recombinase XerD